MRSHELTNLLISFDKLGYNAHTIWGHADSDEWFYEHNGWLMFSPEESYRLLEELRELHESRS